MSLLNVNSVIQGTQIKVNVHVLSVSLCKSQAEGETWFKKKHHLERII